MAVTTAFVLCLQVRADAFDCAKEIKPEPGTLAYRLRGNRCEGLYVSAVSAGGLELVSLTQGSLRYALSPNASLTVRPVEGAPSTSVISVRAVAIPGGTYYRLDASLGSQKALVWPVADVLLPAQLHAGHIGVFGWIERQGEPELLYVPVVVTQKGETPPPGPIRVTVRASVALQSLSWRVYALTPRDTAQTGAPPRPWQRLDKSIPLYAWSGIPIELSADTPGEHVVEMAASVEGSADVQRLRCRVWLPRTKR